LRSKNATPGGKTKVTEDPLPAKPQEKPQPQEKKPPAFIVDKANKDAMRIEIFDEPSKGSAPNSIAEAFLAKRKIA